MTANASSGYRLPVEIVTVTTDRSGQWLAAGWRDFMTAPLISLLYGGAFVLVSFLLAYGLVSVGLGSLVLPLAGGFVMLAPIAVVGLYDVSRRLEEGQHPGFRDVFAAFRSNPGQLSAMGVILLILWFVWVEVAIVLFAVFFNQAPPPLDQFVETVLLSARGAPLLIVGTLVGALFALTIFAITAVSVPLLYDRPLDVVTAIATSILVVRANWRVMFGWAAMIALITATAIAAFFVGLAVALPVLAFATWHAYRDLVRRDVVAGATEVSLGGGI